MKILITGGHITPAIAVIDELRKKKGVEIVMVGRKYSGTTEESFEYKIVTERNLRFIDLKAGRLTRLVTFSSLINILKIPAGFARAFQIIKQEKPEVILSFGGYLALPVAIAGFLMSVPVFIHEQTLAPGLTNRIIARIAKKVFVSFPQTMKMFDQEKVILSGNPIRSSIINDADKSVTVGHERSMILILGGSLGSHSINIIIEEVIDRLLEKYRVVHQTGNVAEYADFDRLSKKFGKNYIVIKHIDEQELGKLYNQADLVISRAGANTVFELIAIKKPAILIPLPWSASGEQTAQAKILSSVGAGEIFDQDTDPQKLLPLINEMMTDLDKYKKNYDSLLPLVKTDAAEILSDYVTYVIK